MIYQNDQISLTLVEDEIFLVEEIDIKISVEQELKKLRDSNNKDVPDDYKNFVGKKITIEDFVQREYHYQDDQTKYIKVQIYFMQHFYNENISEVRMVRGDGNCFYTALGFRILEFCKYDTNVIIELINKYKIYPIVYVEQNSQEILLFEDDQHRSILKQYLINIIQDSLSQRTIDVEEMFRIDGQDYFYEAFIIFIRSLFLNFIKTSEYKNRILYLDYLMVWGEEIHKEDSTEVVICAISHKIQKTIKLVGFKMNKLEYGKDFYTVPLILFFNPGHYAIMYTFDESK